MASRNFARDLGTPDRGLVQYDMIIACQASGAGVDATNSVIPSGFATVARTGVGIYQITLLDGFASVKSIGVTVGNNGTYLPAIQAQPAGYPPFSMTAANSTITIHVGNATVLTDPTVTFALHVTILLKNSTV